MKQIITIALLISLKAWAGCNSPNGIMVTVDITAPSANQKITMNSVNSTFTTLTAASSGDDDNALTWTFTGFVFPSGNSGASVTANAPANWPGDNSFWGQKTVNLEYNGGTEGSAGDCKDTVDVKVFFPPAQDISNEPAWFKYWSLEALPQLASFTYSTSISALGKYTCTYQPFSGSFGSFDCLPKNEVLYIAPGAHTTSVTTPKLSITLSGKPLKIVTCIVEHELDHKSRRNSVNQSVQNLYTQWWNGLSFSQKTYYTFHLQELDAKILEFWNQVDEDRDAVVNSNDPTNNFGSDYDDECAAERAMVGALCNKTKDWSQGGEQW